KATGKRVEEEKAEGSVRWLNCDQTAAYTIPRGTLVRTAGGVGFQTSESVFLPVAIQTGTPPNIRVECSRRNVDIVAVKAGPAGNVDAGTITRVPGAYNPVVIQVTNPRATSGGSREEFPKVTQQDVDGALVTLEGLLDEQLATVADAPPGVPSGTVVVPETAERGEATPTPDPATLIDQEVAEFDLALAATGTVLAVDPADARTVAAATLGASVPADYRLDATSVVIEVGTPVVDGELVTVPATGTATAVRVVDEDEIRALVAGRTPAEAEELLAPYGTAVVTVWPDWVPAITSIDARLTVEVVDVPGASAPPSTPGGTPAPSGTPAASETPAP
ncbi:MAG: baseplate J/gp47 family protein, partial [Chloroflexi bacterium]|nr:baseplate J/gp47 family protein [Chloroflexota bacterium]